jgi:hypothetical protein
MKSQELLALYEQKLREHDWLYEYSDDGRVYRKGQQQYNELISIRQDLQKYGLEDQARALFERYRPKTW